MTDEQKALRSAARELAARHAPERGEGDVPVGPHDHDPKTWTAMAEMGALGLPFAEDVGGFGASPVEVSIVAAELGSAGVQTAYADALVAASLLVSSGSQSGLVEAVTDGSALVLPALTEPQRAWSQTFSSMTASQVGDKWVLSGTKEPVLCVGSATHLVVPAQTNDGLAVFLVETPVVSGARVALVETPATLLLDPSRTPAALAGAVNLGIVTLAGEALGAMDAALSMTVEYLKTRKQFGVPLMKFQTLTQRAADMYVSLELARSTVLFAAMQLADHPDDAAIASRTKVVVGRTGRHIGQEAIQLHGGIGMTAEYSVGHLTARLTAIERTFGDPRQHLAILAGSVRDHAMVDVLS
ncbi:acyl-CoA dehydrogenase family protein [Leekyejoonella antrihumi]|nr:acyl-CoA dehydrogenase family protein [Leekyejoonella antrihumi]